MDALRWESQDSTAALPAAGSAVIITMPEIGRSESKATDAGTGEMAALATPPKKSKSVTLRGHLDKLKTDPGMFFMWNKRFMCVHPADHGRRLLSYWSRCVCCR